jgi:beta-N-acetylhexosaminidase
VAQIDASVRRILEAKASVGLHKARFVDVNALSTVIARPENVVLGQQVADAAVTLLRDNGKVLPLRPPAQVPGTNGGNGAYQAQERKRVVAVVFTDDVRTEGGRSFERELRARIPDAAVFFVDPRIVDGSSEAVLGTLAQAESVVAAVLSAPTAKRTVLVQGKVQASLAVDDASSRLLHVILSRASERTVMVALGSPYTGSAFPEVENYMCTFSSTAISEISAVRALTGEIPIHGRTPVTIPNLAERGAGLDRPVRISRVFKRGHHGN